MFYFKHISKRISLCAFFYWLLTFFMEKTCIDLSGLPNRLPTYLIIRVILYFFILAILLFIASLSKEKRNRLIAIYALPYIIFLIVKWLKEGIYPFIGDEAYIYDAVIHFTNPDQAACSFNYINGMFTYFTTYFYMISIMIFPPLRGIAVVIIKITLCGLSVGYCIYRINHHYCTFCGILIYGIFFFSPSSELGICVQRMPMYGMLYLFFACKLFFDWIEHIPFSRKKCMIYHIIIPILTQWRIEGIYLFVIGPILVSISYRLKNIQDKKRIKQMIISYLLAQLILFLPQGHETLINTQDYTAYRMSHFYNYVLTNMMRYGLQNIADPEDLSAIDRYISLDKVNKLNADLGDECFKDEYITTLDEYNGIREGANLDDLIAYESAMKHIILKHPLFYLRVQLKAFKCVTTQYGIKHIRSACTTFLFGNIALSILIIAIYWIYAIIKKNYFIWWFTSGLLCHTVITTLLLPAAYFKYYYAQYICAGFIVIIILISYFRRIFQESKIKCYKRMASNDAIKP